MKSKAPLRYRWNHRSPIHRHAVKAANSGLAKIPFGPKYQAMRRWRSSKLPYSLVGECDVVVQVGAPADTLSSGRSRGMDLALRTVKGRCVIVEPDPASAKAFERQAELLGLDHVSVVNAGAWHESGTLTLYVDPSHPATNFVEGTVDYDTDRLRDFTRVEVNVVTIDQIVDDILGPRTPIRLLSITTNNSEREILRGASDVARNDLQYLSLARTGEGYHELAESIGFALLSDDDRGYTYYKPHSHRSSSDDMQ